MSGFEWFLLIVVVILVPLIVAIAITLWTLEQARARKRQNREVPADGAPVKRKATRDVAVSDQSAPSSGSRDGDGDHVKDGRDGSDPASDSSSDSDGGDGGGDS